MKTAIIGAGMAGLACARGVHDARQDAQVFDKGRGLGGRMATRRAEDGFQFDHGAQYITAKDPAFRALLNDAVAAGALGEWSVGEGNKTRFVGCPGMTGLPRHMARDLDVTRGATVTALRRQGAGWQLTVNGDTHSFDRVVCTTPAPQTIALLGADHPLSAPLARISYDPCLTLMVGMKDPVTGAPAHLRDDTADLSLIARDSSKPERPGGESWVAQASPDWSRAHLELSKKEIAEAMMPLFTARLGLDPANITYCAAHRWRYARVAQALGQDYLSDDSGTLFIGGDGLLAPRVEAAWQSGTAIARALTV